MMLKHKNVISKPFKFANISLKTKLMFFFVILSLLPTLLVGMVSYEVSTSIIMSKEIDKNYTNLKVVNNVVSNYLDGKRLLGLRLASNKNILSFMNSYDSRVAAPAQNSGEITTLMNEYGNADGIKSIFLFDTHGNTITNDPDRSLTYDSITANTHYLDILASRAYLWGEPVNFNGTNIIPLYVNVADPSNGHNIGLIVLNINEEYVYKLYSDFDVPYGELLVINENGSIVSGKNKYQLRLSLHDVFHLDAALPSDKGYFKKNVINDDLLVTYSKNKPYGWTYVSIERTKELIADSQKIRSITVLLCGASLFVTFLISIFLSEKLTKPLKKLVDVMHEVENENLLVQVNFKSKDEVGLIGNAFDNMVRQLRQSISEIYATQQKLRESEMRILQMQIKPHFLYNTLSSIIWLINSDKKKDAIQMVSALSKFFRVSLGGKGEFISLEGELEQVENYLIIQKIRYKSEFDYVFDLAKDTQNARILKFILQPLVENSIYHGVKGMEYKGLIIVKAFKNKDCLNLEVIDNGVGMDPRRMARINRILSDGGESPEVGIGTTNVNNRIKYFYGKEYGLNYRTENGCTVAGVTLPFTACLYPE